MRQGDEIDLTKIPSNFQPIFMRTKFKLTPEMLLQRIQSKLVEVEGDDCILWQGTHDRDGYPQLDLYTWYGTYRKKFVVSRLYYWLMIGEDPTGQVVCHSCDHPFCLNIKHLWLGSQKENIEDARKKGRR